MTTQATRGRPRKFDADVALDSAVELFWDRGYRATTTRDLERALGIGQSSLYNAFGSKQDLLMRAIDRYEARVEEELFGILARDDDGYKALGAFFTELADWIARNGHRGCLVVNLMTMENGDPVIITRVQAYRQKIRSGLNDALSRIPGLAGDQILLRAELLLAAVLGLHITARTATGTTEVEAIVAAICEQIAAWKASDGAPAPTTES